MHHPPRILQIALVGGFLSFGLNAQITPRPFVQAAGTATVSVPADQATVDASVTTNGTTAQDAASKNADKVNTMVAALSKLLGGTSGLTTVNYYISPTYDTSMNKPPVLTGWVATSTVQMKLPAVSLAGPAIDTAVANGATSVGGISYSVKDSDPARRQALAQATAQAMAHASTIATASGHTVGAILTVQEGIAQSTVPIYTGIAAGAAAGVGASTPTPVQPGLIQVTATVTMTASLD